MYCPKCGTQSSDDSQFCRSCGLSLPLHLQLLTYHRLVNDPEELPADSKERLQGRRHQIFHRVFLTLAMIGALFVVVNGVEYFYLWVASLALLVAGIVGVILSTDVPYLFYPRKLPKTSADRPSSQLREIPQTHVTSQLPEGLYQGVPSVTERTTDLLAPKTKTDTSEKERIGLQGRATGQG
ncbi:MAG: zinc-ribbon domain-containing protein [Pyrinomonadaceae bacterium]